MVSEVGLTSFDSVRAFEQKLKLNVNSRPKGHVKIDRQIARVPSKESVIGKADDNDSQNSNEWM